MRVVVFLGHLVFHAFCGSTEEEGDEKFVSAFVSYLPERIDIGCTVFDVNDEQGVAFHTKSSNCLKSSMMWSAPAAINSSRLPLP